MLKTILQHVYSRVDWFLDELEDIVFIKMLNFRKNMKEL